MASNNSTIIRVKHDACNPYVIINKTIFTDERLSWKAKGLHAYLMSRPDDWKVMVSDLINQSTDGRDSVYSGLNELIKYKYIKRERVYANGRIEHWEYTVYEVPYEEENLLPENPEIENSDLDPDFPDQENLHQANPPLLNKDNTNNDLTNNNREKGGGSVSNNDVVVDDIGGNKNQAGNTFKDLYNSYKISDIAEVKNDSISELKNLTPIGPEPEGNDSLKMPKTPKLKKLTPEERNLSSELSNSRTIPEIKHVTGIVPQEEENVKLQSSVESPAIDSPGQPESPGKSKDAVLSEADNTAVITELKKEIDAVTGGSIALNSVRSLIKHCGENRIRYYTSNFDRFKQVQNINNTVGFFIKAVEEGYPLPVSSTKRNRWADGMMQHTNDFQELEKAIQMRNMQRYLTIKNGCSGFINDVKR
jgi:hypothetical protein